MPTDSNFSIEFPADRDYIPIIQEFLKNFLKNFDFSKEFSEYASLKSLVWLNDVIPSEKFLRTQPIICFEAKTIGSKFTAQIRTSDDKEFTVSIDADNWAVEK
jgi:hypothetical protein